MSLDLEDKRQEVVRHYQSAYQVKLRKLTPHEVMHLWNSMQKLRQSELEHLDRQRLLEINSIQKRG
jgi:predicted metalloprotease with PDZ domain